MVIKVCGIKTEENIKLVARLKVDMVGLNFYPPSARYISPDTSPEIFDILDSKTSRVGVFVNESLETIDLLAKKYKLDYIQLHGDEELEFCKSVAKKYKIIKVFRIDHELDLDQIEQYSFADYILFDTATKNYGGSGLKFNWSQLILYKGKSSFLLSGGIGPEDIQEVVRFNHNKYIGIDINSKFESEPGVKDDLLLIPFVQKIKLHFGKT